MMMNAISRNFSLWRCAVSWRRSLTRPPQGTASSRHSWRQLACSAAAATEATGKKRVVFLGTPEFAASVLKELHAAAQQPDSQFELVAVVTQPPRPRGRGKQLSPTPVEEAAREVLGLSSQHILCPVSAKEEGFLSAFAALQPDLCITAAYGNILPQRFLDLPPLGTLNIHPSLLPKYRGAAPVQRALQEGAAESGVSVAFTVLKCDAGPVLAQERLALDPNIKAPQLLEELFARGVRLLISRLPDVFAGRGPQLAVAQDEAAATHAAKIAKEEGQLDLRRQPASALHNRVRGFAGWPGTSASLLIRDAEAGKEEALEVKVIQTRVAAPAELPADAAAAGEVVLVGDSLLVPCGGGSVLAVLQGQLPTKKVMSGKELRGALRLGKNRRLFVPPPPP